MIDKDSYTIFRIESTANDPAANRRCSLRSFSFTGLNKASTPFLSPKENLLQFRCHVILASLKLLVPLKPLCIYIHTISVAMPQPPGTRTTHHCPGAKISVYIKMGPCYVVNKCCRTHQKQCQDPLCKGWIYLKRDFCIKCENRVRVSLDFHF